MQRNMVKTSFEGVTFLCLEGFPDFLGRYLTRTLLDHCEDNYATTVERICFLSVAAISRAAYLRRPTNAQEQADRQFALDLIHSDEPILMTWDFESLVTSLGATVEAITGFPQRRAKAIAERAAEVARAREELQTLWREAGKRALAERLEREAMEALQG